MSTPTKLRFEWPEGTDPLLIEEVEAYLREQNLAGMRISRPLGEPETGSMAVGDYLPVIQVVLGSTVVATSVKGIFDVIKKAIEMRMHKISTDADLEKARLADAQAARTTDADLEKARIAAGQIRYSIERSGGEKLSLDLNPIDPAERERYSSLIDQAWKNQA